MNRDTRPDVHHGKNHPPKPSKQADKGKTDDLDGELADYLRGSQRKGHKVWIKSQDN